MFLKSTLYSHLIISRTTFVKRSLSIFASAKVTTRSDSTLQGPIAPDIEIQEFPEFKMPPSPLSPNSASNPSKDSEKTIYFIRHGITEMNERLLSINWNHPEFKDGEIFDTRLSPAGIAEAIAKHEHWITAPGTSQDIDFSSVEVILASPLSRTMETAQYLFFHKEKLLGDHVPKLVHPLLRERLYMSSDVGRMRHELIVDFPDWSLDHVPHDSEWWHVHDDDKHGPYEEWRPVERTYVCHGEPDHVFQDRMKDLKNWLLQRPEKTMIVVAHWGVIASLTGLDFKNCEIAKVKGDELLVEPAVA